MIDVHLVTHERARAGTPSDRPRLRAVRTAADRRLGGRRCSGPCCSPLLLSVLGDVVSLPTELMLFLALTVLVALVGGLWPAIVSAVVGFLLLNWFFTLPTGKLTIAEPENALALGVFVLVAAGVASVVDLAARRTTEAFRARAEASALAAISRSVLSGEDTAAALVARLRETFTLEAVSLLARSGAGWDVLATDGVDPALDPEAAQVVLVVDDERVLALTGRVLPASDRRVLEAFASQVGIVLEQERLRAQAEQARILGQADATRTALLAAVSHDLRTPLATIRASVDGLTSTDLDLDDADRAALVGTLEESTARLERLIDNLLDLSRLQTGSVRPVLRATSLDEIVPFAIEGYPPGAVVLDVPDDLPLVHTDPGPPGARRRQPGVQRGPAREDRQPRGRGRRRSSAATSSCGWSTTGRASPTTSRSTCSTRSSGWATPPARASGLGLAVADGLATAVGAELSVEDTPGGGLTMLVTVPLAETAA